MTSQILQSVKKKIYAVCPELSEKVGFMGEIPITKWESIGLPEVLRAIEAKKLGYWAVGSDGRFISLPDETIGAVWNLLVNLDGQSEELIHFLDEIL